MARDLEAEAFSADVPISRPRVFPGIELASFEGFAWTQPFGIVVEYVPRPENWEDDLAG